MIESATRGAQPASGHLDGLAQVVARLRRALRRAARVADPGNQLAVAHLELLSVLAEHPGARPGQLAQILHLRPNTVTTLVNAMVARDMISRTATAGDRRAISLRLTTSGARAVHTWHATNAAILHLALSALSPRQRDALGKAVPALDALVQAVDRLAHSPVALLTDGDRRPAPPSVPTRTSPSQHDPGTPRPSPPARSRRSR